MNEGSFSPAYSSAKLSSYTACRDRYISPLCEHCSADHKKFFLGNFSTSFRGTVWPRFFVFAPVWELKHIRASTCDPLPSLSHFGTFTHGHCKVTVQSHYSFFVTCTPKKEKSA